VTEPKPTGGRGRFLRGALAGLLVAYFWDPDRGRGRRRELRDRAGRILRHDVRRGLRGATAFVVGRTHGLVHGLRPASPHALDDVELAHKVETILFRDPAVPKGQLNVNAEKGKVFLRGQVDSHELALDLEERVRQIAEVLDVENLLHLPGEPAPASHGGAKAPPAGG
jgi:BON domain